MTDREIFKANLKYYFETTGKKQKDLAEYAGFKKTTISGWTRGISYPRADSMEIIANFFGIPTSMLVGERSPNNDYSQNAFTNIELKLVKAYRMASADTKKAVRNVLGVSED